MTVGDTYYGTLALDAVQTNVFDHYFPILENRLFKNMSVLV